MNHNTNQNGIRNANQNFNRPANRNTNQIRNANQNNNQNNATRRRQIGWQGDPEFLERARRLGLCFRCGDQGHQTFECPNKENGQPAQARLNVMEPTIEEASEKGKCSDLPLKCMTSSVHHWKASVVNIMGKIGTQKVNFLVDSGSSHCFLSPKLAEKLNLKLNSHVERPVELANGRTHFTRGYLENLPFHLKTEKHSGNFYVIDMGERMLY